MGSVRFAVSGVQSQSHTIATRMSPCSPLRPHPEQPGCRPSPRSCLFWTLHISGQGKLCRVHLSPLAERFQRSSMLQHTSGLFPLFWSSTSLLNPKGLLLPFLSHSCGDERTGDQSQGNTKKQKHAPRSIISHAPSRRQTGLRGQMH